MRTESAEYIKAMDAATARLNAAHKKKARNRTKNLYVLVNEVLTLIYMVYTAVYSF